MPGRDALPPSVRTRRMGWGSPRPAPRPGRSAERGPGARETQVRLRPEERGGAQNAGRRPRRGFKCIPASEPAALGASSPFSASLLPGPHSVTLPAALGPPTWGVNRGARTERAPRSRPSSSPVRTHGLGAPQGQRGGSAWKRSWTSSPRCSEWNLEWAGNCWNTQPRLCSPPRFAEGKQLPPQSCLPSPRRFVKRGASSEKYLSPREKDVGCSAQ